MALIGPVSDLDENRIAAALKLATGDPAARISLVPSLDSRWEYCASALDRAVSVRPDVDTSDVGGLLTAIGTRPGKRRPVEIIICGDYLVVDYSHGVGDGRFGVTLLAALASTGDDAALFAERLVNSLPADAVWRAVGRHFGVRPARIRDLLRQRIENRKHAKSETDAREGIRRIDDWQAAVRCASGYMNPRTVQQLRAWTSTHAAGSTTAAVTAALWMGALRQEGVRIDEEVVILVDCRRYLSPADSERQGNFAVGIPLLITPSMSPSDITKTVRQVTESGWPAATLASAQVRSHLRAPAAPTMSASAEVSDRLRLVISDVGRPAIFDNVPWRAGSRPPQIAGYVQPDRPGVITLLIGGVAGGRTFTAAFCSEVVPSSVIQDALIHMSTDPVGVLETALR